MGVCGESDIPLYVLHGQYVLYEVQTSQYVVSQN